MCKKNKKIILPVFIVMACIAGCTDASELPSDPVSQNVSTGENEKLLNEDNVKNTQQSDTADRDGGYTQKQEGSSDSKTWISGEYPDDDAVYLFHEKADGSICIDVYYGEIDEQVYIPEQIDNKSVSEIAAEAFADHDEIKSIYIPESVCKVGKGAFRNCSRLIAVNIPSGISELTDELFKECICLSEIHLSDNITKIGDSAFESCISLSAVSLGENTEQIGSYAFKDCMMLENFVIPQSCYEVGDGVFYGCCSLKHITLSERLGLITDMMFFECSALKDIVLPDNLIAIGKEAFYGCSSLTAVRMPDSVVECGERAFMSCKSLAEIVLSDNISKIEESTFMCCTALEIISIGSAVNCIGDYAFAGCSSLSELLIDEKPSYIGNGAFLDCCLDEALLESGDIRIDELFCFSISESASGDDYSAEGIKRQLMEGRVIQAPECFRCDLDGDGIAEAVVFENNKILGNKRSILLYAAGNLIVVNINNSCEGMKLLEGGNKEVLLAVTFCSRNSQLSNIVYAYADGKLKNCGVINASIPSECRNGTIMIEEECNIFADSTRYSEYVVSAEGIIAKYEQGICRTDISCFLNEKLPVHVEMDSNSEKIYLHKGQKVRITATDGKEWFLIENSDGIGGWVRIADNCVVELKKATTEVLSKIE